MYSPELEKEQKSACDLCADKEKEKLIGTKDNKYKRLLAVAIQLSTVAWTTVANIAVGVFLGRWLDKLLGSEPVFIILLSLSGVVASILFIFRFSRKR